MYETIDLFFRRKFVRVNRKTLLQSATPKQILVHAIMSMPNINIELSQKQLEDHLIFVYRTGEPFMLSTMPSDAERNELSKGEYTVIMAHLTSICPICQVDPSSYGCETDNDIHVLACGHTLHRDCLVSFMASSTSSKCPMCRAPIGALILPPKHPNNSVDDFRLSFGISKGTIPIWDEVDNVQLPVPYILNHNKTKISTASQMRGMYTILSKPMTANHYHFTVKLPINNFYSIVGIITTIPTDRNFGKNFKTCPELEVGYWAGSYEYVGFDIDMHKRTADILLSSQGKLTKKQITGLPYTIYLAATIKAGGYDDFSISIC